MGEDIGDLAHGDDVTALCRRNIEDRGRGRLDSIVPAVGGAVETAPRRADERSRDDPADRQRIDSSQTETSADFACDASCLRGACLLRVPVPHEPLSRLTDRVIIVKVLDDLGDQGREVGTLIDRQEMFPGPISHLGEIRDVLTATLGAVPQEEVAEYLDVLARLGVLERVSG